MCEEASEDEKKKTYEDIMVKHFQNLITKKNALTNISRKLKELQVR